MTIELFCPQRQPADGGYRRQRPLRTDHQPDPALLDGTVKSGFAGSDRLAALAYRSGQYPMAASLLKNAGDSGLAWWLRAKWRCVTVM